MTYNTQLQKYRAEKDNFFGKHPQSPLAHQDQKNFSGLDYYPINEDYKFELALQPYDEIETIEMDTSDGQTRYYKRIGYLEFSVEGQESKIHVYQSEQGHYFVPFRDETSGKETYGAGRYLDLEMRGGVFVLDFNLAYNPMCAYSDHYSCPFPPYENWLEIPIRAGEKKFGDH